MLIVRAFKCGPEDRAVLHCASEGLMSFASTPNRSNIAVQRLEDLEQAIAASQE